MILVQPVLNRHITKIITIDIMNNEKVIVINQHAGQFVKNIHTSRNPRDLTCNLAVEAWDFKTVQNAKDYIDEAGFKNMVILRLVD